MKNYPWLVSEYKKIVKKYYNNKLHPIILIQSHIGFGVSRLIFNISQWILCSNKKKEKSCKRCLSCILINKKKHPDFYNSNYISQNKYIGINITRTIINNIYQTSQQGGAKIIWFSSINRLTTEAQNSLLKILEEPPENTIFFLNTSNIKTVLSTIKSRSTIYYINLPKEKENLIWLKKKNKIYTSIQLLTALRINNNAPIITHKFLNSKKLNERNIFMIAINKYMIDKKYINLLKIILNYKKKKIIIWICYLILDVIKYIVCNKYKIQNLDQIKLIKKIAKKNNFNILIKHLKSWIQCKKILSSSYHIDKKLILTEQILLLANDILNI
ncbi:DNA polymerase III subunit delta' C-terminal domain-containing protein [Buchnera aphidicola]|uniref:DNA polymerase III subunit delta' n=1 Tax=Buchnera aphidicola (Cinara curvipes) TaxID=2518975 RepID=A0A451D6T9_9GAMM|nr:DNA polymerase III subunit delta' C-terminal domain-containing protein [Buchnera aphidicola]VFP81517.1 DNA polymerase III subunit delta' [Buchnera aphidicola (Cinara curvipes)]